MLSPHALQQSLRRGALRVRIACGKLVRLPRALTGGFTLSWPDGQSSWALSSLQGRFETAAIASLATFILLPFLRAAAQDAVSVRTLWIARARARRLACATRWTVW